MKQIFSAFVGVAWLVFGFAPPIAFSEDVDNSGGRVKRGSTTKITLTEGKVKSKLMLVESLVSGSSTAKRVDGSENEEAKAILAEARKLLADGKEALQAGDLEKANESLTVAMRNASKASRLVPKKKQNGELEKERFESAKKSVSNSIKAIDRLVAEKGESLIDGIDLNKMKILAGEGLVLGEDGKYNDANVKLFEARKMANKALSLLRSNDTVTLSLEFDSPAEEYKYVVGRNRSYETLIEVMKKEKKPSGMKLEKIEQFVGESHAILKEADSLVKDEDYDAAIKTVDKATKSLAKALRSLGVMVFD